MATRRELNALHEAAVVNAAVAAHNTLTGANFSIVERPDPPDAILSDGQTKRWLEHTDAFYPGWALDLTTFAASDKEHIPMAVGVYVNMDETLAAVFCSVVLKKLTNPAYRVLVDEFGPGILVVGLESPWLSEGTVYAISRMWRERGSDELHDVFSHLYLGYRRHGENLAVLWKPS